MSRYDEPAVHVDENRIRLNTQMDRIMGKPARIQIYVDSSGNYFKLIPSTWGYRADYYNRKDGMRKNPIEPARFHARAEVTGLRLGRWLHIPNTEYEFVHLSSLYGLIERPDKYTRIRVFGQETYIRIRPMYVEISATLYTKMGAPERVAITLNPIDLTIHLEPSVAGYKPQKRRQDTHSRGVRITVRNITDSLPTGRYDAITSVGKMGGEFKLTERKQYL